MANAAIAGVNLVHSVSATSQELLLPASNLMTPHVEQRWRSRTPSDAIVCDLGAAVPLDTIVVRGVTAGPASTVRIRVSALDASGVAGELYDSDSGPAASFDPAYDAIVGLMPAPVTGRYVRVDIHDPDESYVEAGVVFVCRRTAFTYNYSYGWQIQWVDRGSAQESRGGQTLTWGDNRYRTVQIDFKWITTEQRYGVVEQIDRDNGITKSVLLILDTASVNLSRDVILGTIVNQTPVVSPDPVFDSGGVLFSKSYQIKERL
jgi:hypothetical protein